jgi:hypothetical protein
VRTFSVAFVLAFCGADSLSAGNCSTDVQTLASGWTLFVPFDLLISIFAANFYTAENGKRSANLRRVLKWAVEATGPGHVTNIGASS